MARMCVDIRRREKVVEYRENMNGLISYHTFKIVHFNHRLNKRYNEHSDSYSEPRVDGGMDFPT